MSKPVKEETDQTLGRIYLFYRKKCETFGIIPSTIIKAKLQDAVADNKFAQFQMAEQLGPIQVRALFETLCELKAHKLSSIRIWKASIGDEGVRNICKYASQVGRLEILDLLDNGVTMLGCEFIAKMLPMTALKQLKLDDNLMGTTGLRELSLALRQDSHLDKLSLKYCGIDNNGAKYLVQVLANISSKLRSLKLQGNPLGNNAAYEVLRAADTSQALQKINLADTKMVLLNYRRKKKLQQDTKHKLQEDSPDKPDQTPMRKFQELKRTTLDLQQQISEAKEPTSQAKQLISEAGSDKFQSIGRQLPEFAQPSFYLDHEELIEDKLGYQLLRMVSRNLLIIKYDIRFNPMNNELAEELLKALECNKMVKKIELPTNVRLDLRQAMADLIRKRNGKGKKGKGGKSIGKKKGKSVAKGEGTGKAKSKGKGKSVSKKK